MDWRYVWAYHRIADRSGRRAPGISSQLAALAEREWQELPPCERGLALWTGSAWGSYAKWKSVGIRNPRNFFAPDKNPVNKLEEFAASPLLLQAQANFAELLASDPADRNALQALGWSAELFSFQGVVVVGWGIPKGVVWVGCVADPAVWHKTPEQRALELYLPLRRLAHRPHAPALDGDLLAEPWHQLNTMPRERRRWQRSVGASALAATRGARGDAFVSLLPSKAEIAALRERQLYEQKPAILVDESSIDDLARYFPWLWYFQPTDAQPSLPFIPAEEAFGTALELLIVYSALAYVHPRVPLEVVLRCHEALFCGREEQLALRLQRDDLLKRLRIPLQAYLLHTGLRRWLTRIAEWLNFSSDAFLRARAAVLWEAYETRDGVVRLFTRSKAEGG